VSSETAGLFRVGELGSIPQQWLPRARGFPSSSRKIEAAEWGDAVVDRLAQFIVRTEPGLRGFTRRNLLRMRQFYEAYREDKKVSPLATQLPWLHHLIILGQSKRPEEREFHVRLAIQERWSERELERQFKTALFERVVLSAPKVFPAVTQMYPDALSVFRDAYTVEFLGLLRAHAEADLRRGLPDKLKDIPNRIASSLIGDD
jgi:predicted nuclease of restriction endonuclease-like (RecB) superfamily